jgi:ABC-type transporter MlaC component
MNWRTKLAGVGAIVAVLVLPCAAAQALDTTAASEFVGTATRDAFGALAGKTLPRAERVRILAHLLDHYANLRRTSEALLGRSWMLASAADQERFQNTLLEYFIAQWADHLVDIPAEQRVVVRGAEPQGDQIIVHSLCTSPGEDAMPVDWSVREADGKPFVADVSMEGISLVRMMRADFSSVLFANAGRIDALIAAMRSKIEVAASGAARGS